MINGMNNGLQQIAKQPVLLAGLTAVNPWILVGIGGLALFTIFAGIKNDEREASQAVKNPPVQRLPSVSMEVKQSLNKNRIHDSDIYKSMSSEELKKEMIRQAMSELGRRSGMARAKKKDLKI